MSATTLPSAANQPEVLVFGLDCQFTAAVLSQLVEGKSPVTGLVLPGPPRLVGLQRVKRPKLNLLEGAASVSHASVALAHRLGIPVYRTGALNDRQTRKEIAGLSADLLVCACFDRLIPCRIYSAMPLGGINCHPSLLPDLRGPDPVFWTFKRGDGSAGVTIHRLTSKLDAGPILAQEAFTYPDGTTESEFDDISGKLAGDLIVAHLSEICASSQSEVPQDDTAANMAPFPRLKDFRLNTDSSARASFNFVRGIEGRRVPFSIELDGTEHVVHRVTGYATSSRNLPPAEEEPAASEIAFADGVLYAILG